MGFRDSIDVNVHQGHIQFDVSRTLGVEHRMTLENTRKFVKWAITEHQKLVAGVLKARFVAQNPRDSRTPARSPDMHRRMLSLCQNRSGSVSDATAVEVILIASALRLSLEEVVLRIVQGGEYEHFLYKIAGMPSNSGDITQVLNVCLFTKKSDTSIVFRAMRTMQYLLRKSAVVPVMPRHIYKCVGEYFAPDAKGGWQKLLDIEKVTGRHTKYYDFCLLCHAYRVPVPVALRAVLHVTKCRSVYEAEDQDIEMTPSQIEKYLLTDAMQYITRRCSSIA